jgi:hypothetical protein
MCQQVSESESAEIFSGAMVLAIIKSRRGFMGMDGNERLIDERDGHD